MDEQMEEQLGIFTPRNGAGQTLESPPMEDIEQVALTTPPLMDGTSPVELVTPDEIEAMEDVTETPVESQTPSGSGRRRRLNIMGSQASDVAYEELPYRVPPSARPIVKAPPPTPPLPNVTESKVEVKAVPTKPPPTLWPNKAANPR